MNSDELKSYLEEVGLDNDQVGECLAHFGKKGMRWGVTSSKNSMTKAARKQEVFKEFRKNQNFVRRVTSGSTAILAYNLARAVKLNKKQSAALAVSTAGITNSTLRLVGSHRLSEFSSNY
jgi:hypothetical protein